MNQEDEVLECIDDKMKEVVNDGHPTYRKHVLRALRDLRVRLMEIFGHGD